MTPQNDLDALCSSFCSRVDRLRFVYATRPRLSTAELDRTTAFCTIELANAWTQFARAYYLSCTKGARTRAGARVTHNNVFRTYDDAVLYSVKAFKKTFKGVPTRRDEPDWSNPSTLLKLADGLAFSNKKQINTAFGVTTKIFSPLVTCRNFFAHRGQNTADKIEKLSRSLAFIPPPRRATVLLNSALPGKSRTVFEDWSSALGIIGSALAA